MLIMVSIGMMVVIVSGGIDLSVGSVMGLSGMIAALVLRDHRQIPIAALFLIAMGVGLICGTITGFVVAKLRIFPLIGTLGTCDILRGVIYLFSKGEWVSQTDMTEDFLAISTGTFLGINYMVWFAVIVVAFGFVFMGHTRFGRHIYAVGNNEANARISGIHTERTKWAAYMLSGMIAGLAGLLWVCKYACVQGTTATGFELNVIASVVLGGVSHHRRFRDRGGSCPWFRSLWHAEQYSAVDSGVLLLAEGDPRGGDPDLGHYQCTGQQKGGTKSPGKERTE